MVSGWAAVDVVVVWLGLGLGPGNAYREWYWSGGRLKTRGTVCSCCWAPFGTWNGQGVGVTVVGGVGAGRYALGAAAVCNFLGGIGGDRCTA